VHHGCICSSNARRIMSRQNIRHMHAYVRGIIECMKAQQAGGQQEKLAGHILVHIPYTSNDRCKDRHANATPHSKAPMVGLASCMHPSASDAQGMALCMAPHTDHMLPTCCMHAAHRLASINAHVHTSCPKGRVYDSASRRI
jgi:hypothetical protein